jgi:two-component system cell cycle sensor histidine kinase/response regulator CckA
MVRGSGGPHSKRRSAPLSGARSTEAVDGPIPGPAPEAEPCDHDCAAAAELRLLRKVLSNTTARLLYYDRAGGVSFATAAANRSLGVPWEKLQGATLEQVGLPPEQRRSLDALWARVLETRLPVHETVAAASHGVTGDTELHVIPTFDQDGEVDGIVVTAWDVTEANQAVRRIRQLERIRAILSQTNQVIVRVVDAATLLAETCHVAVELGGFELAWVGLVEPDGKVRVAASAGQDVTLLDNAVVTIGDEPTGRGVVGTSIRDGRPCVVENAVGDERMAAWRSQLAGQNFRTAAAFPLSAGGHVIGALALYSSVRGYFDAEEVSLFTELAADVSYGLESLETRDAKKQADEALGDSEQRYRDLFEKNPNPMWVYDKETLRILAVNDAGVSTYGYSRDEFLGLTLRDIRPAEEVPAMLTSVAEPSPGYSRRGSWRHLRKDGSVMEVEIAGHDLDWAGRSCRLVSIADVTERKRVEAQLAEATRMEAMGHLAGGIAHDFNNLLTAVNGYSEMLVAALGDSPLADDAREIRRAGQRATELTQQVLAFSRRQVLSPRAVDVNAIVGSVKNMLRRLIGEPIKLTTSLASEPAVVIADPGQLEQVLVNLAINSCDAMPDGGTLEIHVRLLEDATRLGRDMSGPAVLLAVTDSGSGMDQTTLVHAFEPFFTTKPAGAGTGLGLATVHGIVHQSKGTVWAESVVGQGTTVSILLPRVDAVPEPLTGPASAEIQGAVSATTLVVEDESTVRGFVVATLERVGYRVLVAASPAEAIALADGLDETIDLLLTDLVMPTMGGQALAERLMESRPDLRVVLMSGYDPDLVAAPMSGPFHFVAKPFGGDELLAVVARVLAEETR